jgi:hypothetical protein
MPGLHWTKVVLAPATLQLVLCELQYVLQYIVINRNIAHKKLILVLLLHFSGALEQNTTGIITAATIAAAGGNGPLAPNMSSCTPRQRIELMGDNPPSKQV